MVVYSFGTFVNIYQTTRRKVPENSNSQNILSIPLYVKMLGIYSRKSKRCVLPSSCHFNWCIKTFSQMQYTLPSEIYKYEEMFDFHWLWKPNMKGRCHFYLFCDEQIQILESCFLFTNCFTCIGCPINSSLHT